MPTALGGCEDDVGVPAFPMPSQVCKLGGSPAGARPETVCGPSDSLLMPLIHGRRTAQPSFTGGYRYLLMRGSPYLGGLRPAPAHEALGGWGLGREGHRLVSWGAQSFVAGVLSAGTGRSNLWRCAQLCVLGEDWGPRFC